MTMLRKLIHAKELDEEDPKPEGEESRYRTLLTEHQAFAHHLSRLSNIWSCEHTVEMLLDLYTCGPHMLDSKLTNINYLQRFAEIHGGVSLILLSNYNSHLTPLQLVCNLTHQAHTILMNIMKKGEFCTVDDQNCDPCHSPPRAGPVIFDIEDGIAHHCAAFTDCDFFNVNSCGSCDFAAFTGRVIFDLDDCYSCWRYAACIVSSAFDDDSSCRCYDACIVSLAFDGHQHRTIGARRCAWHSWYYCHRSDQYPSGHHISSCDTTFGPYYLFRGLSRKSDDHRPSS